MFSLSSRNMLLQPALVLQEKDYALYAERPERIAASAQKDDELLNSMLSVFIRNNEVVLVMLDQERLNWNEASVQRQLGRLKVLAESALALLAVVRWAQSSSTARSRGSMRKTRKKKPSAGLENVSRKELASIIAKVREDKSEKKNLEGSWNKTQRIKRDADLVDRGRISALHRSRSTKKKSTHGAKSEHDRHYDAASSMSLRLSKNQDSRRSVGNSKSMGGTRGATTMKMRRSCRYSPFAYNKLGDSSY